MVQPHRLMPHPEYLQKTATMETDVEEQTPPISNDPYMMSVPYLNLHGESIQQGEYGGMYQTLQKRHAWRT